MNTRWVVGLRVMLVAVAIGFSIFYIALLAKQPQATTLKTPPKSQEISAKSSQRVVGVDSLTNDSSKGSTLSRHGVLRVPDGTTIVPDRMLVHFRKGTTPAEHSAALARANASVAVAYKLVPGLELLSLPAGSSVADAVDIMSHDPAVKYAVPDLSVKLAATPNDPKYSSQWGLPAIGAPAAWGRTTGSANVTVAVIDTGAKIDHPDLAANLVSGWNFVNDTNNPSDDYGHGTHVAGIIGAAGNNGIGISGVNWNVSIMPLKICDSQGSCNLDKEISAIQYAIAHGAKVINASFGGYGGYQPEEDAIAAAGQAGLLYVAAAGNSSTNNDFFPFTPASYPLDNIISVAATNSTGGLADFSNYGFSSVHIAAPGDQIYSTLPTTGPLSNSSGYGNQSGTSMAAPHVSGSAALLWAEHPGWTMQQVRTRLLTTASPMASLSGKVSDCGRLNVDAATNTNLPDKAIICVKINGSGGGTVSSNPAGISCGTTCAVNVSPGTEMTLTASPSPGSTFIGWRGACSGTGTCVIIADQVKDLKATFQSSGSPFGWQQGPLAAPEGRDPFAPGSKFGPNSPSTFYNVAVSADGSERARTIFNSPPNICDYNSSDTGGIFLQRYTADGWVDDGKITAPNIPGYAGDPAGRWANCSGFGNVAQLSADGTTLLVTPDMASVYDPSSPGSRYRCAAYVYQHGSGGWSLETTLYPPGVGARGSVNWDGCGYFGTGGAISADGSRIAIGTLGINSSGQGVQKANIYTRSLGVWSLEQQLTAPRPNADCAGSIGPRMLSMSGDGATLLIGGSDCDDAGTLYVTGLVFAYARSGTQWTLTQTIHSPAPTEYQHFGNWTALSQDGKTAAIGNGDVYQTPSTWVFERDSSGWQVKTLLPYTVSSSNTVGVGFSCPTIVQNGAQIICGVLDDIGFNPGQGSIYVFDRPTGGWGSVGRTKQIAFATDGVESDQLGISTAYGWIILAAPENGSFIDAPISPLRYVSTNSLHDRIGYEFTTGGIPTPDKPLTVNKSGSGSGSVTSDPAGIKCGSICQNDFPDNTLITLSANPSTNSIFAGWSGDCSGTGSCTLQMTQARNVTANYSLINTNLSVSKSGNGSGTVTSSPAGIDCGLTCSHTYNFGSNVTLTATAAAGSKFIGWSGDCSGTGNCTLQMIGTRSPIANFTLLEKLTVTKSGVGSGTVTSTPAGINCGLTCAYNFIYGRSVSLTATPAAGSKFIGWSGACTGTLSCTVTMTQARSVTASFTIPKKLTVTKYGHGKVTSAPSGISCGLTCSRNFNYGASVTLTATPATGFKFVGWSGACTGTSTTCVVSMTVARTAIANYT